MKKFLILPAIALALTACGGNPAPSKPVEALHYDATGRWDMTFTGQGGFGSGLQYSASTQVDGMSKGNDFSTTKLYTSVGSNTLVPNKLQVPVMYGNTKSGKVNVILQQTANNFTGPVNTVVEVGFYCEGTFNTANHTYSGTCEGVGLQNQIRMTDKIVVVMKKR